MAPNFDLEEAEESALAELDAVSVALAETPEELQELQELGGDEVEFNPDLPENFVEIIQARAPRRQQVSEPHFPDAGIEEFIQEKTEAFHESRTVHIGTVMQIQGSPDPAVIEGTSEVVDNWEDPEEPIEQVFQQEEVQAHHVKYKFKLGGRVYG